MNKIQKIYPGDLVFSHYSEHVMCIAFNQIKQYDKTCIYIGGLLKNMNMLTITNMSLTSFKWRKASIT